VKSEDRSVWEQVVEREIGEKDYRRLKDLSNRGGSHIPQKRTKRMFELYVLSLFPGGDL
jgi:hypothetical protein